MRLLLIFSCSLFISCSFGINAQSVVNKVIQTHLSLDLDHFLIHDVDVYDYVFIYDDRIEILVNKKTIVFSRDDFERDIGSNGSYSLTFKNDDMFLTLVFSPYPLVTSDVKLVFSLFSHIGLDEPNFRRFFRSIFVDDLMIK